MIDLDENPGVHRFDHEAMNTLFTLRIEHPDRGRAQRASGACFERLDRVEDRLSRYRDDSDISRINVLEKGESLFIEEDTYACLKLAAQAYQATGGLFDVTLGARIEHVKRNAPGEVPELRGRIELAPDRPMVVCAEPGRQIDLGGIGKGYGLECMAAVLLDLEIESALLGCAGSTLLALGPKSWPVALRGENDMRTVELCRNALSASGSAFQGAHILHPEASETTYGFLRTWVVAKSAAMADAFSTACMLMDGEEIAEFRSCTPEVLSLFAEPVPGGEIQTIDPSTPENPD